LGYGRLVLSSNRTTLSAIFAGGAFVALTIAFVQVRSSNREARDEMDELRASMRALRSELGQPRFAGSIEHVAAPLADPVALAPSGPDEPDGHEAAQPAAPASADEAQAGTFEEALQRSEAQFRDEPIDAAWAGSTTSAVERTLAMIIPTGASVRGLSCHSTRCRLEMNLRDAGSLDAFQREALYGSNVLWRGQMMIDHDELPDGSVAMVAHLIREATP
jgi:hypothetical protein